MKFKFLLLGWKYFVLLPFLSTSLSAQDSFPLPEEQTTSLWGMIQQGGWAMYPLGGCSLIMFFLIFYCWKESGRRKFIQEGVEQDCLSLLSEFKIGEAVELLNRSNTVLTRVMAKALRRIKADMPGMNKQKAETVLMEYLEAEESSVAQWVNYLNVVGAVSPMIGLLGTVSGMISAFQTIGQGGMGRPELLAGDIGEALITTASGLIVGIPAMIFFFVLRNRLSRSVMETSQLASDFLDEIPINIVPEFQEDVSP